VPHGPLAESCRALMGAIEMKLIGHQHVERAQRAPAANPRPEQERIQRTPRESQRQRLAGMALRWVNTLWWRPWAGRNTTSRSPRSCPKSQAVGGAPEGVLDSEAPRIGFEPFHGVEAAAAEHAEAGLGQIQATVDGRVELLIGWRKKEGEREDARRFQALAGARPPGSRTRFRGLFLSELARGGRGCRWGGPSQSDFAASVTRAFMETDWQSPPQGSCSTVGNRLFEADAPKTVGQFL